MSRENVSSYPASVNTESRNLSSVEGETGGSGARDHVLGIAGLPYEVTAPNTIRGLAISPADENGPSPTNRGVQTLQSGRKVLCGLDWFTLSLPRLTDDQVEKVIDNFAWLGFVSDQERKYQGGYHGHAVAGATGTSQLSFRKSAMDGRVDIIVVLGGQSVGFLNAQGIPDLEILRRFQEIKKHFEGGRFTRLDLCVDVFDSAVSVGSWYEEVRAGRFKSATRGKEMPDGTFRNRYKGFDSDGKWNAFELGRRAGSRLMRVYDKTLEQMLAGLQDVPADWTRVELQCNNDEDCADKAASLVLEGGFKVSLALINGFFTLTDDAAWKEIFSESTKFGLKGRAASKPDKVLRWLKSKASGIAKNLGVAIRYGFGGSIMAEIKKQGAQLAPHVEAQWAALVAALAVKPEMCPI